MDWIKTSAGEIVNKDNIDSYMPQMSKTDAEALAKSIYDESVAVTAGTRSWEGYFNTLNNTNRGYVVDLIKNTDDLSKLTGDDLVKANQNARQAAIAHNAALKQQTLGAKAAKFAMSALATVGNMIVFTLISEGISKLMNAEAEALEKAQASYEAAVEEVNKLNEREDVALSSAKELSALFSDEDWGSESAKRASEIYDSMADRLEEIGGAEDDRIQQLRDEARQIKENITLSKAERKAKADEARKNALIDAGWSDGTEANSNERTFKESQNVFWKKVDNVFDASWYNFGLSGQLYELEGNVFKSNRKITKPTEFSDDIMNAIGEYFTVDTPSGQEFIKLKGISGTNNDEFTAAMRLVEKVRELRKISGINSDPLFNAVDKAVREFESEYDAMKHDEDAVPLSKAQEDAFTYLTEHGFRLDSVVLALFYF